MRSKVEELLQVVSNIPGLSCQIFSGEPPGNIKKALLNGSEVLGTLIANA
jgi:hypothetical protein